MQKINIFLLILLFVAFLFGEIARIPLINGVAISLLDISTFCMFIIVLFRFFQNRSSLQSFLVKPLAIFLITCLLSLITNIYWLTPTEILIAFLYIVRYVLIFGVFFFTLTLPKAIKNRIPFFLVLLSVLLVLIGLLQYFYIDFTSLRYLDWDIHWYRLFSTFIDPNFMGVFLLIPLFLALFQVVQSKPKSKLFYYFSASSLILLSGILLTYSRTAIVGIIAGLVAFALTSKKARKIVAIIAICFAIGIGIILLNYQATEGTKLFRLSSSQARFTSINYSLTIFKNHPLLGTGFNAYRYAMHKYGFAISSNWQYSHSDAGTDNSFLFVLATTGIIGFISFSYLLYTIIYRIIVKGSRENKLKPVTLSAIVAICVSSVFINALFYPLILAQFLILLGITDEKP